MFRVTALIQNSRRSAYFECLTGWSIGPQWHSLLSQSWVEYPYYDIRAWQGIVLTCVHSWEIHELKIAPKISRPLMMCKFLEWTQKVVSSFLSFLSRVLLNNQGFSNLVFYEIHFSIRKFNVLLSQSHTCEPCLQRSTSIPNYSFLARLDAELT